MLQSSSNLYFGNMEILWREGKVEAVKSRAGTARGQSVGTEDSPSCTAQTTVWLRQSLKTAEVNA